MGLDIIILNETWLLKQEINLFQLPNYSAIYNCRSDKKGGGTVIFVSNNIIKYKILACKDKYNQILIQLEMKKHNITVGTMYRHEANMQEFFEELEQIICKHKNLIFAGDMNINLLNKNSTHTNEYLNLLSNYEFEIKNIIDNNHFTRNASGSIIDHVFSDLYQTIEVRIQNISFSDHNALFFDSNMDVKVDRNTVTKEFKITDYEKYKTKVCDSINNLSSIEDLIETMKTAKIESTKTVYKRVS